MHSWYDEFDFEYDSHMGLDSDESEVVNYSLEIYNKMKENLRNHFSEKMTKMEKELQELREFKEKHLKNSYDVEALKGRLVFEYEQKEKEMLKAPINQLTKHIQKVYYTIDTYYEEKEKCDCCDENRNIVFFDAYGRNFEHKCACAGTMFKGYKIETRYFLFIKRLAKPSTKDGLVMEIVCTDNSTPFTDEDVDNYRHKEVYDSREIILSYRDIENNSALTDAIKKGVPKRLLFTKETDAQRYIGEINNTSAMIKRIQDSKMEVY